LTGPDPGTQERTYQAALRLLGRCDRSETDLARRLKRQGFEESRVNAAIDRCRELGYLDDQRLATRWAEQLLTSGRAAGPRLRLELLKKGIAKELAETAAATAEASASPATALTELRRRRFPSFSYRQADASERRRVVNFFQRRGFPLGMILEQLKLDLTDIE